MPDQPQRHRKSATLRYASFPPFVLALVKLGFLDDSDGVKSWLQPGNNLSWADVTTKLVGARDSKELPAAIAGKCQFANAYEESQVMNGLHWLGLLDDKVKATIRGTPAQNREGFGNPLDTLCATLEEKCKYEDSQQ